MPVTRRAKRPPTAFTLLELLVVIGIIILLAAILLPVASQVRMRSYVASTQGQMQKIEAALEAYYHDFKAYPGPLSNSQLLGATPPPPVPAQMATDPNVTPPPPTFKASTITSSENLVLGLFGILSAPANVGDPPLYSGLPPKHDLLNLNPLRPASYHYIDYIPEELSAPTGIPPANYAYSNRTGTMNGTGKLNIDGAATSLNDTDSSHAQPVGLDSPVPEFVDRIPVPNFMPILYLRANVGIQPGAGYSGIATSNMATNPAQYDVTQLSYYGFNHVNPADFPIPTQPLPPTNTNDAQWIAYFNNPNLAGQPRGKDGFILISAGADRLYGTKDDIIVTP